MSKKSSSPTLPLPKFLQSIESYEIIDYVAALGTLLDRRVIIDEFEDLPRRTGTIESIDDDSIGIMVDADNTAIAHYAEIYKESFSLVELADV